MKKLSKFLKSHISGIPEAISLKFGMWSTEAGWNVHSKIRLVSSRQHRATEVRKLRFLSSCQYAARHTTVCLDLIQNSQAVKKECGPQKAMVKKHVKSKVAAKKWL